MTTAVGPIVLVAALTALLLILFAHRGRARCALALSAALALTVTPMAAANAAATPTAPRPLSAQSDFQPMATEQVPTYRLSADDLDFIWNQIQIAEAHAYAMVTGDTNYSLLCARNDDMSGKCVRDPMLPHGLRTVDGSFNNLEFDETWGSANQLMPRMLPIDFRQAEPGPQDAPPNPPGVTEVCEDPESTCYEMDAPVHFVYDTHPRVISNLIVDQTTNNPAAIAAYEDNPDAEVNPATGEYYLPNRTADEELSAPMNLWFVFFGQFFDHGLDLVNKGGNGTIIVPLRPDDPLYVEGSDTNFMMLDRATNRGPEGDERQHENRTTPFVDQNQTYTSHPSHQVFLREYELVDGRPVDTGRLLNGQNGGLATWNDVKRQAREVLGIELTDAEVLHVPQVYVDYYGNFVPDPETGFPQLMLAGDGDEAEAGMASGTPEDPVDATLAIDLNQSFLDDIAHGAVPTFSDDPELCPDGPPCLAGYDNVALGEHFVTGDGRGNENIGLTAVHHVFHAEHNRLVDAINDTLDDNPDLKAKYEGTGEWDEPDNWTYNQRIFQAARFANEMQYQHLVFEEFARAIVPTIDEVVFNENAYDSTIDPSIKAEFAHVVYRFGHSMLTTEIEREIGGPEVPATGVEPMPLLDGFLNPVAFHCAVRPTVANTCPAGQELAPEDAAGAIVNGTVRQPANQIDEMVTSTLRNNLLGLPLDLPAINIMRGRDVGVPSLNEARRVFHAQSKNPNLRPYESWWDFDVELRNGNNFGRSQSERGSASLVNFIAAYGTHETVVEATTLTDKRIAAEVLVYGDTVLDRVRRTSGPDRYGTAAAVAQSRFTGGAPVAYVAAGGDFPDALAGGPGAALDGAPLLLVGQNSIPAPTALELIRLNPQQIKVLGGPGAVSDQVVNSLGTYTTGQVMRLFGPDRYATAAAISAHTYPAGSDTVFIASGRNFPDALAAGPAAAVAGGPVLLVQPGGIPAATATELARLQPSKIVVLGGAVAVSDTVFNQLDAQYQTVERVSGATRYETSVAISQQFFPADGGGTVYVSTGTAFPDALSASAVAGITSAPILLVPGQGELPAAVAAEIMRLNPDEVVVLGGEVAVSAAMESALEALFEQPPTVEDREDFMNGTGEWANQETGINNVDFWVGGLAERVDAFGNLLGPTFSYVFEQQLEDLQFGDRFYYLFRNQGEDLFALLEANTFSSLIQRTTNASLLPADIFRSQDLVLDLENLPNPLPAQLRVLPGGGYQWDGDEHIEIHGHRTMDDYIIGGEGDDALWGYGGNDRIEGRAGNDSIVGGPGDDILTDTFGDDDIKGGDGHDAINAGPGVDLVLGGDGNDFVVKPQDNSAGATAFLGQGDDIFLGGSGRDNPFGGPGDDWLEGGAHADLLMGDRGQQFQDDEKGGDDILIGGPGSDDMDAEGGMDIMVGNSGGTDRYHGMFGFDWVTYDGDPLGVDADLNFNILQPPDVTAIRDRYLQVEALSGGSGDDVLRGKGRTAEDTLANADVNKMTEEDLAKIEGLEALLRPPAATTDYATLFLAGALTPERDGVNNIILGGAGSDIIEGRPGDDFIDGDAVLRVRLVHDGTEYASAAELESGVFAGTINPGDITMVRQIVVDEGTDQDEDTLVYTGAYWPEEDEDEEEEELEPNFSIELLHDGYWQITDLDDPELGEGSDIVRNIEVVQFGDGTCFTLVPDGTLGECASLGFVTFGGQIDPPTEDEPLTAEVHFEDAEGNPTVTNPTQIRFNWQIGEPGDWEPSPTGDSMPDPGGLSDTFTPGDADVDEMLRVVVTFRDDDGRPRQIASGVVGTEDDPFPEVENVNDPPSEVTLNTLDPVVGQGLVASSFTDADGLEDALEEGLTYTWQSSADGFVTDIEELSVRVTGEDTTFGYLVRAEDVGRQIRVVITYTDDMDTDEEIISPATNPVVGTP